MGLNKPIVLVGPMGVGKSTIGRKLARRLGVKFTDTDQVFFRKYGDITKFFEEFGEPKFRELEEDLVLECLGEGGVIATGGGAVLSEKTREALPLAFVIYLSTDGRHLSSRLTKGSRPLLKSGGLQTWRKIYESRRDLYEQVADYTLDTSSLALGQSISACVEELEKNGISD